MASDTIPTKPAACKGAQEAYHSGVMALDLIEMDAERMAETAFALSTAEAFDNNAQAAFYALGQLGEALRKRSQIEGGRLEQLRDEAKEAGQ